MKIKFLALSIAFAAVSVALSFCSKESAAPSSNTAVTTEQNTIDPYVSTDRGACDITVVVTAGGPVTICGTNLNALTCTTTTVPPVGLTGVTVATVGVPVTFTVTSPTFLKFTNSGNGNSFVSVSGGPKVTGFNLTPNQQKNVAISGVDCSPTVL